MSRWAPSPTAGVGRKETEQMGQAKALLSEPLGPGASAPLTPGEPHGRADGGLHGGKGELVTHGAAGLGQWGAHGRGAPGGPIRGALGSLGWAPRWKQEQELGQQ